MNTTKLVTNRAFKILRRNMSMLNIEQLLSEQNKVKTLESFKKLTKIKYGEKIKRHAAILVPICVSDKNEISILYTLRSSKLRSHKGQISFPGGHMEELDGHEIECALRETQEEIGLSSEYIKVWGTGSQITPSFGISIVPVIAEIRNFKPSMVQANPSEVEEVFTIPLERLIDPNLVRYTQFRTSASGHGYVLPVYLGGTRKFWGMTALVTHFLLQSLLPKDVYKVKIPYLASYLKL